MKTQYKIIALAISLALLVCFTLSSFATHPAIKGKTDSEIMKTLLNITLNDEEAQMVADQLTDGFSGGMTKEKIQGENGAGYANFVFLGVNEDGTAYVYDGSLWEKADDNLKLWICQLLVSLYLSGNSVESEDEYYALIEDTSNIEYYKTYGLSLQDVSHVFATYPYSREKISNIPDSFYEYLDSMLGDTRDELTEQVYSTLYNYLWPAEPETTTTTTTKIVTTITNRFRDMTNIARATNVTNVSATNVSLPY